MEIKILDKETIDKIAAGEVVERPVNVVKELMENAIDSGATAISLEIKDGGKSLIRITDNGCGIPKDQVRTAFLRHATSKIRNASDLSFISTLGFRGEALSSIAAVSFVEMCTKIKEDDTGIIYKISSGTELSSDEAGLPDGTTIIINDLFKNTPARLKFLASSQTEGNSVQEAVYKIALSHPEIAIKFINNGAVRLNTAGSGSLKDVIYAVFGKDIASSLLDISFENELIAVSGFIGKPEVQRSNRNYENFFVNGRYIKNKILSAALEEAFKGYQMKGSYPFCVLNIRMEPELMDVNVHPTKLEIRFSDGESVYDAVNFAVSDRIKNKENIPQFTINTKEDEAERKAEIKQEAQILKMPSPEPFEIRRKEQEIPVVKEPSYYMSSETTEESAGPFADNSPEKSEVSGPNAPAPVKYEQQTIFEDKFFGESARLKHKVIGEVFDTYWIVEYGNNMYIIDQHAAHEKILYERFMKKIKNGSLTSQFIAPGIVVSLSPKEEECLKMYMDDFTRLGFDIDQFGNSDYIISAVPADLFGINNQMLFTSFLDELNDSPVRIASEVIDARIATAACKAAVKGGNAISREEADKLIDELLKLDNPYNCPHGRPTIITMSKYEMEKKFKRIV